MGWELITPDSLAELDSSQNSKLTNVEANATAGAAWGSNLTGRPTELTDGRVSSGLASNGDVARTVAVGKGGTGETATNRFLNNQINVSTSNNSIIIQRGGYSDTTVTGLSQSLVNLSGVANNADVTGSNTAYDTARVNGTTASTVRSGAAAGATANQDSTASIRAGTTKANVGLGNVPNFSAETMRAGTTKSHVGLGNVDNNSTATIRAGTTKANVGLGNVPNYTAATMMAQNHTGSLNGVAAATVTSGASLGATANQDSTSTIRNGVTTATITSGSNSHVWTIESDTEYAPNVGTLTTTIQWRNGSGSLLTTATIVSDINEDDRNIDVTRSGSGVSFTGSGTASNIGAGGSTTVASYNSIKVSVFHAVIDTSSWTFK